MILVAGVLAVIAAIIIHEWNQQQPHKPTRQIKPTEFQESIEADKNRLRQEVLKIVAAQQDLPQDCLDRIINEIQGRPCESYYILRMAKPDGGAETMRVPTTLWDVLRWCVLRNDAPTMEKARELEKKTNLSSADCKKKTYHLYDTWRRVDKLFDTMYPNAPAEHRDVWTERLNQQTMSTFNKLVEQLSSYGSRLIRREPNRRLAST